MLDISFKPIFVRQYRKLPKRLGEEIKERIELFRKEPFHPFLKTHKLKGILKGSWSFSVNYRYRIVFEFTSKNEVDLLAVGDHSIYD